MTKATRRTKSRKPVAPKLRRIQPELARVRILDAAVAEFAARGFTAASTNAIAQAAGVAKGLVFHHFESKVDLYFTIVDRVGDRLVAEFLARTDWPTDLFELLYEISAHKVRFFQRDPRSYRVLASLGEAPAEMRERLFAMAATTRARVWPHLLANVDTRKLRRGVSLEDALETIVALGEGLERTLVAKLRDLPDFGASSIQRLLDEAWKHYERLRDGLYA
jgi:TetR/AcrR family transcriptional regulator